MYTTNLQELWLLYLHYYIAYNCSRFYLQRNTTAPGNFPQDGSSNGSCSIALVGIELQHWTLGRKCKETHLYV